AFDRGWILDAPMGGDGLARPDRADLARGVVAHGDDEVDPWRAGFRELVPALAAQARGGKAEGPQRVEAERIDLAVGVAPRRMSLEASLAEMDEQHLGHDRARGVAGAEEEDVVRL